MNETALMPLVPYYRSRFGANAPRCQAYKAMHEGKLVTVTVGKLIYCNVRASDAKLGLTTSAEAA